MQAMKLSIVSVSVVVAVLIGLAIAWAAPTEAVKQQALVDKARITVDSFVADPFGSYKAKRRLLGPVFNLQGGDATEFTFVVGDKDTV